MSTAGIRRNIVRHAGVLAILLTVAACATNPVTGKKELTLMSEAQEIEVGQQMDAEVQREMGLYRDEDLQRYIEEIGSRLARLSQRPNLPWHFTVVDEQAINAFALPGGYIYITRGILPYLDNEAQLAGVIGHEIGHVNARHAVQAYTRATGAGIGLTVLSIFVPATRPFGQLAETAASVMFLKYGREDELQADHLGAQYAAAAGWNPAGVQEMLNTLERIEEVSDRKGIPNWLSTHPQPADRMTKIQATIQELSPKGDRQYVTNRDEYLRHINGIVYGDSPEEGVVRGSELLHPDMRFAIQFPDQWEINNGKQQVVAKAPGQEMYMVLQLVQDARGNIEDVAMRAMNRAGYRLIQGGRTSINGLDSFIGTYQGSAQGLGRVVVRAAHIQHERRVFLVAGLAKPDAFDKVEPELTGAIRSFRPLSRSEAAEIRPNRIGLYEVRQGDTWQSIAQRQGASLVKASTLAIMNGHAASEQPKPGERIKIVVAG